MFSLERIEYSEPDDMDRKQQEQQLFKETAKLLADDKITTEEACELFTEWVGEHAVTKDSCSPFNFKLTPEERAIQSGKHKFGLCSSCDVGLDDRADFHVYFNDEKMELTCNACDHHFTGGGAC